MRRKPRYSTRACKPTRTQSEGRRPVVGDDDDNEEDDSDEDDDDDDDDDDEEEEEKEGEVGEAVERCA